MILAKSESTYGADPTPTTSSDAIQAFDVQLTPEIDSLERRDVGPSISRLSELGGKQRATVTFTTELKGSGVAGTAPDDDPLWQACGMAVTNVGGTSDTYDFLSASFVGCTIYVYQDGLQKQLHGCVGNYEIDMTAGETPKVKWEFKGLYETPTDVSFPTSYTVSSAIAKVCKNLTVSFDSYAAVIDNLNLKSNNTIAERSDLNAATGIAGYQITDRNPEGSFTPEAVLLATQNWYTKFEADTANVLSAALSNGAGNITTITASQCRIRNINFGERDGVLTNEIPFQMARSGTDDELSIVFT